MSPALFQVLSDLHLETHANYNFKILRKAPYLALLGDIGLVSDDRLFPFLEKQVETFWIVFLVLGNHEPYGFSFPLAKQRMQRFATEMEAKRLKSTIGRFVLLDQTRYDLGKLSILGCTLFSKVKPEQMVAVSSKLCDFQKIKDWTISDHCAAHESDITWLNAEVAKISEEDAARQIVIFTHHSPSTDERANNPVHKGSSVTSGFVTDLSESLCWKSPAVKAWAFGHTHYNCDFVDEVTKKRIIANQKGYSGFTRERFDVNKIVELGE